MARPSTLPAPSHELVLKALRKSKQPLTAYALLQKLASVGIKSPPIIYRALDTLIASGAVHPIKAQGAFIACNCAADHTHSLSLLAICGCGRVDELHDHALIHHFGKLPGMGVRLVDDAVIELPVICGDCAGHA